MSATGDGADAKDTGRLEAFSDGVFAIAVTLLVLELHVPRPADLGGHSLFAALWDEWPSYLAFVTSFLTILVVWVNHHNVFKQIGRVDQTFLLLNGLLLLVISVVPFTTALIAAYIEHPEGRTAAAVYVGSCLAMAIAFNRVWAYAIANRRLLRRDAHMATVRATTRSFYLGLSLYVVAFVLVFVSPLISLAFVAALAVFFALPVSAVRESRASIIPEPPTSETTAD